MNSAPGIAVKALAGLCLLPALAPGVRAQDAAAVWATLQKPAFAPEKSSAIGGVALVRDRIRITFDGGNISFTQPVEGLVFGAEFRGRGRVSVEPPNDIEARQLEVRSGSREFAFEFTEAVLNFTDGTAAELASRAQGASAGAVAGSLYADWQRERLYFHTYVLPRIFKSLLSADRARTAFFTADLKTTGKGWVHVRWDALEPEEIQAGRWISTGVISIIDRWMVFPAGGKSAAEAFQDPLAREDFHIRGYRISASVTAGAELGATTQVTIDHTVAGERVLLFELDPSLRVTSVKDGQGGTLPFFQPRDPKDGTQYQGDHVAVVLPARTAAGVSNTVEFVYAGKRVVRKVGPGSYFCQSGGWYPTRPNSFATRANFDMTFRSPKSYSLVATGAKTGESRDDNHLITTWKSEIPLAVAGFAFGDYKLVTEKAGAVDVDIYANKEPDDELRNILDSIDSAGRLGGPSLNVSLGTLSPSALAGTMGQEMANTLRVFETFFGPYPYKRLAVTNIPYSYGQGWPGLIYLSMLSFLDSTQRQQFGIRDHVQLTDFFRAHESSHQWWGHRVGWKSYHDQWISEGFAQFSGNLYVQFRRSFKEYVGRVREDRKALDTPDLKNRPVESLGPVWMGYRLSSQDSPRATQIVMYNKGGLILNMLRMMLINPRLAQPDERFIAMMKDFCQAYDNRAASTEDFKALAEKHMLPVMDVDGNGKLDWFFKQYVYGTGIPTYEFKYSVAPIEGGKWKFSGTITQRGVPEGWKDILPLYVHSGDRTIRIAWLTMRKAQDSFDAVLPFKPDRLSVNAQEDILAEIKQ